MNALRRVGVSIFVVLGLVLAPTVTQAGAAAFNPTPGEYFVDTSTLELTGPGGPIATGVDEGGVAVFAFDSINIPVGAEIFAEGSRPLELRSAGAFTLAGFIEASGFDASQFVPGPNPGGPGGGAGSTSGFEAGEGPGAGGASSDNEGGGGGGGFGGAGAAGGPAGGGAGGPAYGDLESVLQGGSGGAGGTAAAGLDVGGGGGGGAVKLTASSLSIPSSGAIFAEGGNGNGGGFGASGGGSGGGILLHANTIDVTGLLSAEGGDGGTGGCCGDGGGGGGGRIAYRYVNLVNAGEASVAGGESGVSGTFGHGSLSPEATGGPGVITKTQGPTATTSAATAVGLTGATLNGIVNPHGHATTYQFQLGTSTAYGTTIPVPAGDVGSDSADHALLQAVLGLQPNTTYHYRIVATGFGFIAPGADTTFTTAPKCSGVKIAKGRAKVKNGKAQIRLSSVGVCKGELSLFMKAPPKGKAKGHGKGKGSASKKGKGKGAKSIPIGSASFSLNAGEAKTIAVSLSAAALKRLKLGKALPATAKATASDGLGPKVTTQANVSLKLAKKGKGPKKGKGKGPKNRS
jgi:hypothetical protein